MEKAEYGDYLTSLGDFCLSPWGTFCA